MHKFLNIFKWMLCFFLVGTAITIHTRAKMEVPPKNNKFLLCISSFKRPIFLSGQILRMMNQTYQNFDMSVSIKGVDKAWAEETFVKEWQPFIDKGRLILRFDPNGYQIHNFLDTVRDIDRTKYDYFCKIDDDDWYMPDYLEEVNESLNSEENISVTGSHNTYILTENIDEVVFYKNNTELMGPTLCFSRKVIETALEIEKNPKLLGTYLPNDSHPWLFIQREDRVLHHLGRALGPENLRNAGEPKVIYGWQYRSVTRNDNYVSYEKK